MNLDTKIFSYFYYDNTKLCEPPDPDFQQWLDDVRYVHNNGINQCFYDIAIHKIDPGISLTWTHVGGDVDSYNIYRSTDPYFTIDDSLLFWQQTAPMTMTLITYEDATAFDDVPTNYYYRVTAVVPRDDNVADDGWRGGFSYELVAGQP
jgi:hypothetical protein